jgi:hypothetical protein
LRRKDVAQKQDDGSEKTEQADPAALAAAIENTAVLEARLSEQDVLLETITGERDALTEQLAGMTGERDALSEQLAGMTGERDAAIAERDALQAKLAKLDAAPRTRSGKAKARKCGPIEAAGFAPHELLAEIGAAELVEIVFSDGAVEVGIPPVLPSGKAWAVTPVGLQLRVPELPVEAPMAGPVKLAGYGLFLDGEQVAWGPRADVLDVMPGRKMDMRHDVVFPAG